MWGDTSARVIEPLRPVGRLAVCGQISGYLAGRTPALDIDWHLILGRFLTLQGFRTVDYRERWREARSQLAEWVLDGTLRQEVNCGRGLPGRWLAC